MKEDVLDVHCSNNDYGLYEEHIFPLMISIRPLRWTRPGEPVLESVLSSDQNDKCPSAYNDLLVFTSDREGGYGGFDLYMVQSDGVIVENHP